MKIGNPADKPAGPVPVAPTQPAGKAAQAHESGAPVADPSAKVELSNTASTLLSGSATHSDFDADKVARIAQAIADGQFKIDADKIADRLIANANEVLGKAQH